LKFLPKTRNMHHPASPLLPMLGIDYPVVQGAMLGVTTPAMVAAISNAGGLGSLPLGGLSPDEARLLIQQTRQLTNRPFAVNLFAHDIPAAIPASTIAAMQALLADFCRQRQLPITPVQIQAPRFYNHLDLAPLLVEEKIDIVSFTFGRLDSETTALFKAAVMKLIGTATSTAEALLLQADGCDAVTLQGVEAGGHRGTFGDTHPLPQTGLFALLAQAIPQLQIPALAAGGIASTRGIQAALQLGASGIQLGTLFIPSHESRAAEGYKQAVLQAGDTATTLTRAFSGRWARGIRNELMEAVETAGIEIPPYVFQNLLTSAIRRYGQEHNLPELISMWAGQAAGQSREAAAADIFKELVQNL